MQDDSLPPQENHQWPWRCFKWLVAPWQYCKKGSMKFIILNCSQTGVFLFILLEAQSSAPGMLPRTLLQAGLLMQNQMMQTWRTLPSINAGYWCLPTHVCQWEEKSLPRTSWETAGKKLTSSFQIIFHRPRVTMENTNNRTLITLKEYILYLSTILCCTNFNFLY